MPKHCSKISYIMGKHLLIFAFLLCFCAISAAAQTNLVRNPGFDTLHSCPRPEYPNLDNAIGWFSGVPEGVVPRRTTLFNACAPVSSRISVPNNLAGNYQPARSGSGYAGLFVYWPGYLTGPLSYTEFVESRLRKKLSKDRQYYIEFYTNPHFRLTDDPNTTNTFIGSMGLALSDSEKNVHDVPNGFYHLRATIENDAKKVLDDTGKWYRINGAIHAKGIEEYVLVGNFHTAAETYQKTIPAGANPSPAYYFVEDVGVYEFDPLEDTLYLCPGSTINLNAHFLDATYQWNTGSNDSVLEISRPGVYYVDVTLDDVSMRDSVIVIAPGELQRDRDTAACLNGIPLKLKAPLEGEYVWNTGSTDPVITVSEEGSYSVAVSNECGTFSFTWEVHNKLCTCEVFVPNAFTPNGDGRNDFFKAVYYCNYELYDFYFRVYNRWGECVYMAFNIADIGWDGKRKGLSQPLDTYFWTLSYSIKNAGNAETIHKKGDCILIR